MPKLPDQVLFEGHFNSGLGIYNAKDRIATVPECTWHDDDVCRLILRDDKLVIQEEINEVWEDCQTLEGDVYSLFVSGWDEDGDHSVFIKSETTIFEALVFEEGQDSLKPLE